MDKLLFTKEYYWDYKYNKLFLNGEIYLNKNESKLLELLFKHPYCTSTYIELVDKIWNDNLFKRKDDLNYLINNIKKKLPINIIDEVKGLGFRIINHV